MVTNPRGEDGYELWLRYCQVGNADRLAQYRRAIASVTLPGKSATVAIITAELARSLPVLLGRAVPISEQKPIGNALVLGTIDGLKAAGMAIPRVDYTGMDEQGYLIRSIQVENNNWTFITGNSETALLTGTFHFLRLLQTQRDIHNVDISSHPRIRYRLLSHWDNLDGSIERGYAGQSLWNWSELPKQIDVRYHDYARACASIGINGTILNNVNANAKILTPEYLVKIATLADVFRPYGLRVYLSPVLSAPIQLGDLTTDDPRDPTVAKWWKRKVDEIYRLVPDFGGFQVKANSEGQPGPQDHGANHDDGANMLAQTLKSYGGMLLWRAFVYDTSIDADRAKSAYKEFVPLDGKFLPNTLVQVKNGPIDFQPREPFHPLFGAMQKTPLALELQITQEYLGQSIHLVYMAGMWREILDSDTFCKGPGSAVARIIDGSLLGHAISCIVGVANTGSERNWCGHHFAQANWYAFGRLAWDHELSAETIADEWVRMTWSNDPVILDDIKTMLLGSWPACVNYMTPLGLHHLMQEGHHYGPDPALHTAKRVDWNNVYYHRVDKKGLGFDRSSAGSNAVSQYHSPLREQFNNLETCPKEFLLWFHHIPWEYRLQSGQTLWEELQNSYDAGISFVKNMQSLWLCLHDKIDPTRHEHVSERLEQQLENARLWQKVCISYFGHFAGNGTIVQRS
jgi:alpha-glucuronidase